jgi:hypothetical protein
MYGNNYRERFIRTEDSNNIPDQNNLVNAIENLRKEEVKRYNKYSFTKLVF